MTSIQVCVMGFYLLKVGPPPPWKNFLDPRLSCISAIYSNHLCVLTPKPAVYICACIHESVRQSTQYQLINRMNIEYVVF